MVRLNDCPNMTKAVYCGWKATTQLKHNTVEIQWLKHLWNHEIMLEAGLVQANECSS